MSDKIRTFEEIDQEIVNAMYACGDLYTRIRAMEADFELVNQKINSLIIEKANMVKEKEQSNAKPV